MSFWQKNTQLYETSRYLAKCCAMNGFIHPWNSNLTSTANIPHLKLTNIILKHVNVLKLDCFDVNENWVILLSISFSIFHTVFSFTTTGQSSAGCDYLETHLLQQFRVIRNHLNSKCLTSIIVFDIQVRSSIQ